jgi:predicted nucleic acid-binding protein
MTYVLDSSVALKWVLTEPDSPKAIQLREDARNGVHDLLAPDFFPVELTHAITRAERQGRITPAGKTRAASRGPGHLSYLPFGVVARRSPM